MFHFTGGELPSYAAYSLKMALLAWPNEVYLIHDHPVHREFHGLNISRPESWYDPVPFQEWARRTEMPLDFRGGFWHHAVERFFMLDQWSQAMRYDRFLHCELDVAIFRSSELLQVLEKQAPAVYYPRASASHAGANWLFSSSPQAFGKLVGFLALNSGKAYEMQLLARFLDEYPLEAKAVPSHFTLESLESGSDAEAIGLLKEWGGVIDVHPLGTWLLGHDPRNVRIGPVLNKWYYDEIGSDFLQSLKFRYSRRNRALTVSGTSGPSWPVFALHVHSKRMHTGYVPILLILHVYLLKFPFKIPIAFRGFLPWTAGFFVSVLDPVYIWVRRLWHAHLARSER